MKNDQPDPQPKGFLWQKHVQVADWVTRFTVGEDDRWDTMLLPYDAEATRAHGWGLAQIGVLTQDEFADIETALDGLLEAYRGGGIVVTQADEDCHTVIEHYLTRHTGTAGAKIHTGRSRNDQVLAALRLFLRTHLAEIGRQTAQLATTLCTLGDRYAEALMPGYTHQQRAMPTTAGLWALGYAELLGEDLKTLHEAHDHVNVSPLGSAAGYGVPHLPLPRQAVAERLGFRAIQAHVTAVQLSRGKLELQVLHALVQVAATINRMAADLVLYNTAEYGFVRLPSEYCTGSSIMPQKQNPDVLELARATYHRLIAEMHLLLTLPANLPSGYHRDLQLTKEAVMRGVLRAHDLLTAMNHLTPGLTFDAERMRAACTPELFATADALRRVQAGQPFREAYRAAAQDPAAWAEARAADPLAAYQAPGFPGQGDPEGLSAAIAHAAAWAS